MIINELQWYKLRTMDRARFKTGSSSSNGSGGAAPGMSTASMNGGGGGAAGKGSESNAAGTGKSQTAAAQAAQQAAAQANADNAKGVEAGPNSAISQTAAQAAQDAARAGNAEKASNVSATPSWAEQKSSEVAASVGDAEGRAQSQAFSGATNAYQSNLAEAKSKGLTGEAAESYAAQQTALQASKAALTASSVLTGANALGALGGGVSGLSMAAQAGKLGSDMSGYAAQSLMAGKGFLGKGAVEVGKSLLGLLGSKGLSEAGKSLASKNSSETNNPTYDPSIAARANATNVGGEKGPVSNISSISNSENTAPGSVIGHNDYTPGTPGTVDNGGKENSVKGITTGNTYNGGSVDNGSLASGGSGSLKPPSRDSESLGFATFNKDEANYDQDNWNRGMETQSSGLVSDEECKHFARRAFAEDHPSWGKVRKIIIERLG